MAEWIYQSYEDGSPSKTRCVSFVGIFCKVVWWLGDVGF